MKKTLSRILALILALSMLLVSSAFAAERNAVTATIGNFTLEVNEETLEIPVYLSLSGGADIPGARGYVTANMGNDDQVALAFYSAFENGEIKAYLDGMSQGIVIPLEQLVALLEEQLGSSLEDALSEFKSEMGTAFSPDMQASMTALVQSAMQLKNMGELDTEAMLNALGVSSFKLGELIVALFDVNAETVVHSYEMPSTSLKDIMNALSTLSPEMEAYISEYISFVNKILAESGEEMTAEQALEMVSLGVNGEIYKADEGAYGTLRVSITANGETLEIPVVFTTLTDEFGSYSEVYMEVSAGGEDFKMNVYTDDYVEDGGAYKKFDFEMAFYDHATGKQTNYLGLCPYISETEDGTTAGLEFHVYSEGTEAEVDIAHLCYGATHTEEADSYDGILYAQGLLNGEMIFESNLNTNLRIFSVPEEELLNFTDSINPLEADEAALGKLITEVEGVASKGVSILMQSPGVMNLVLSFMNK